jgi:hypothetical protein
MGRLPTITRRTIARIGFVTVQWILLTIALGAVVVFSSDSLREFVEPSLDGSLIFFAAFIAAFVFGMSIESFKVLMPLVILMCLGASLVFAMVLLSPTFADVTVRTNSLENYAATRVFLFTVLMGLPALVGAGFGNLAGGFVRDDILGPEDQIDGVDRSSWYERRGSSTTATDADSPQRGV